MNVQANGVRVIASSRDHESQPTSDFADIRMRYRGELIGAETEHSLEIGQVELLRTVDGEVVNDEVNLVCDFVNMFRGS